MARKREVCNFSGNSSPMQTSSSLRYCLCPDSELEIKIRVDIWMKVAGTITGC